MSEADREPVWIEAVALGLAHDEVVAESGGLQGIRDPALLESALMRARNAWSYGERDLVRLAALHAHGVAQNHPFADGNKRAAFLAAAAFLELNGFRIVAEEADAAVQMFALAGGETDVDSFAPWLRANVETQG